MLMFQSELINNCSLQRQQLLLRHRLSCLLQPAAGKPHHVCVLQDLTSGRDKINAEMELLGVGNRSMNFQVRAETKLLPFGFIYYRLVKTIQLNVILFGH